MLGQGGFGKVFLGIERATGKKYAIKAIRKDLLIQKNMFEKAALERDILIMTDHPFLCGADYVFQTEHRLYLVMPFVNGGELDRICIKRRRLEESEVKFYIAQIIIGIGELHEKDIVHRDLKLSNILLDHTGYIKIIDFGLAKNLKQGDLAKSFAGTQHYLAPEILTSKGSNKAVDWWSVGVILYEMIFGYTPFRGNSRKGVAQKIINANLEFPERSSSSLNYSDEVVDLISKLLIKNRSTRLGSLADAAEILAHPWFADLDLHALERLEIQPPIKPSQSDEENMQFFKTANNL